MDSSTLNPLAPPFLLGQKTGVNQLSDCDIERIRSAVKTDFSGLAKGGTDDSVLSNLADMFTYFYTSIHSLESKAEIVDSVQTKQRLHSLEREVNFLNYENAQLKLYIASVEDTARFLNLRIEGMTEHNNSNLIKQAAKVLAKTGVQCHPSDIDYARRIGKFRTGHIRPVLVRFLRESKRNAILYGRNNVNKNRPQNSKTPFIWVNDDVSDLTRRNRKNVRDIATSAKIQGVTNVKVHGDGLVVGEGKYRHKDLDLLPANLALIGAKTREEAEDIFFQGEYSPLSNFFPCYIEDEDSTEFCSVEQAFQYRKACFLGYDSTSEKILKTRDPYEVKRLSNLMATNEEWKAIEQQTMVTLLRMKFTQNDELQLFLLETGEKSLHEASNNELWATGVELSSKALETRNWTGLDMLGNLLMDLRRELFTDQQTPPPQGSIINDQPCNDTELLPMPDDELDRESDHGSDHGSDHNNCSTTLASKVVTTIPSPAAPTVQPPKETSVQPVISTTQSPSPPQTLTQFKRKPNRCIPPLWLNPNTHTHTANQEQRPTIFHRSQFKLQPAAKRKPVLHLILSVQRATRNELRKKPRTRNFSTPFCLVSSFQVFESLRTKNACQACTHSGGQPRQALEIVAAAGIRGYKL